MVKTVLKKLYKVEEDLTETWLEDWAEAGTAEIEDFLAKHAEFFDWLVEHEAETA